MLRKLMLKRTTACLKCLQLRSINPQSRREWDGEMAFEEGSSSDVEASVEKSKFDKTTSAAVVDPCNKFLTSYMWELPEMETLIRGLRHLGKERSLSPLQRRQVHSVTEQLQQRLQFCYGSTVEDRPATKDECDMASLYMNRVEIFNEELACNMEAHQYCGESAYTILLRMNRWRWFNNMAFVRKGRILCSVPKAYNTLLWILAKEGRSDCTLKVMKWIKSDHLLPDYESYLAVLASLGHPKSRTSYKVEVSIVKQMREEGHSLENILIRDDFDRSTMVHILRVLYRVDPTFNLKMRQIDTEEKRYKDFPVLSRYRHSKISRNNPLVGVLTKDELMPSFHAQLEAEDRGITEIEPIVEMHPDHVRKESLRAELIAEQERWRAQLTRSLKSFIIRGKSLQHFDNANVNVYYLLQLLPLETYVDLMIQEIDFLVSETIAQFVPNRGSQIRLGERVHFEYLKRRREEVDHNEKLTKIYADYLPSIMCDAERDPKKTNLADTWERVAGPILKENSLEPKTKLWNTTTNVKIGYSLYNLMYLHLKFNVKVFGISSVREECPVIYESLEQRDAKLETFVKVHPVLLRWYSAAGLPPLRFLASQLPMLCPPKPWVHPERQTFGNFLVSQDYASKLVRSIEVGHNSRLGAAYLEGISRRQYSPVLDALNVINSVAWRVNSSVLDTVTHVFRSGGDRQLLRKLSLPPASHDLPDPPSQPDASLPYPERVALSKAILQAQKERGEARSLWCTELYRLSIANKFRDQTIWLPHSMDFRGRVYPCPPHFNYMGGDVSRSLLNFAKGRPLGPKGLEWLMIHLVNLIGLKKRSSNADRLAFAHTIVDEIIDSAERPLDGRRWWTQEDDPWQVLACCKEIAAALKSPDHRYFVSHFPVHQDGSCNGLQHYAALGRDERGADCVNLTPRAVPQDVYSDVGELVEKRRAADAAKGLEIAKQLDGYVRRKVIKQSVMTTVYGVTMYGAKLQIARQLKEFDEFPEHLISEASTYLADLTLSSIDLIFTSSTKIQDWLVASAREIASKRRVCVEWTTPLGLKVMQPYVKEIDSESLARRTTLPDASKQGRAFPPNYVHSLDSVHMMLTALHCFRAGITFSAVHDCYWTHAADVDTMNAICRQQFVALHEQPLLQNLSEDIVKQYAFDDEDLSEMKPKEADAARESNATFRAVPSRGDLNIRKVLKSEYFFS